MPQWEGSKPVLTAVSQLPQHRVSEAGPGGGEKIEQVSVWKLGTLGQC